jgi:hypothetical protein
MNKKRTISIILIVLVIIFIGIVGYFTLIKKQTVPFITKKTPPTTLPTLEKVSSYDLNFDVRDIEVGSFDLYQYKEYVYIRFKNIKNNKYYIQINNQIYGPYDNFLDFQFSKDGSKYGWTFIKDGKYYIQLNNQTYGPYDYDYADYLRFSNDSSKYGWKFGKDCKYYEGICYKCKQNYIQINNQTYGPYKKDYFDLTFSEDNKVYIIYIKDNKMIIEQID